MAAATADIFWAVRQNRTARPAQNFIEGELQCPWGWSHFDASAPAQMDSADYRTNCKPCHLPAKATGYIYMQGYPSP